VTYRLDKKSEKEKKWYPKKNKDGSYETCV